MSVSPQQEYHLNRLTSREKWINPYEVLELYAEAADEDVRKKYRNISKYIHPDKCHDERAVPAFHVLNSAYETLKDEGQKVHYQSIMREARERVEFERRKENRRREMLGLGQLPDDTFYVEVQEMSNRIFREMEERRINIDRADFTMRKRQRHEEEQRREEEQRKAAEQKRWERSRDKRVNAWRNFVAKKEKKSAKRRMRGFEMKPPPVKTEERNKL